MPQTPLTKGRTLGDVVRNLWHPAYCMGEFFLVNPNAVAYAAQSLVGQPVSISGDEATLLEPGGEANAEGILMHPGLLELGISETTDKKYPVLLRGPALIDQDSLPLEDLAGVAFTVATLVTAYAALDPPIIVQRQPTTLSEQTT